MDKKISGFMVHCEICARRDGDIMRTDYHTRLGEAHDLKLPLKGSMFGSPDPDRKVPAPFPRADSWQHMKCPRCRRLPWVFTEKDLERYLYQGGPDRIYTDDGWLYLESDDRSDTVDPEDPDSAPQVMTYDQHKEIINRKF